MLHESLLLFPPHEPAKTHPRPRGSTPDRCSRLGRYPPRSCGRAIFDERRTCRSSQPGSLRSYSRLPSTQPGTAGDCPCDRPD